MQLALHLYNNQPVPGASCKQGIRLKIAIGYCTNADEHQRFKGLLLKEAGGRGEEQGNAIMMQECNVLFVTYV